MIMVAVIIINSDLLSTVN